jgi:hypothetical protein
MNKNPYCKLFYEKNVLSKYISIQIKHFGHPYLMSRNLGEGSMNDFVMNSQQRDKGKHTQKG